MLTALDATLRDYNDLLESAYWENLFELRLLLFSTLRMRHVAK